jgi:hypothetical protein
MCPGEKKAAVMILINSGELLRASAYIKRMESDGIDVSRLKAAVYRALLETSGADAAETYRRTGDL